MSSSMGAPGFAFPSRDFICIGGKRSEEREWRKGEAVVAGHTPLNEDAYHGLPDDLLHVRVPIVVHVLHHVLEEWKKKGIHQSVMRCRAV